MNSRMRGATLVELVVSIVVISVGLAGVLIVMDRNVRASADPILVHQATAIAEAYLEEVALKSYTDPDGTNVGETRPTFDDINDYNFTDVGARDNSGGPPISGLEAYTVTVATSPATLNGVAGTLVTVTVTPPFGAPVVTLSSYRMPNGFGP
jgi:MSHA pilin protein MshD